jgi:two-component system osmolarity sensor histidine kinase EnvZ
MFFAWLKRYVPGGLYGRAALILLLPIVTLQVVVSIVFIQRHFEDVTRQMSRSVVLDLGHLLNEVHETDSPAEALAHTRDLRRDLELDVTLPAADPAPPGTVRRLFYDVSGRTVVATLADDIPELRAIDLARSSRDVTVQLDTDLGPMEVVFSRRLVTASNPHQFLVIMGVFGVLMTAVAFVYLRNQLRPITRLAAAAEAFGQGRVVPYRPAGAREVRAAGAAFLDMRARIERQIEQRTRMLSGISHDLRTPLTRLRLGLSMLPEGRANSGDIAEMERDVAEMEALIDAFLQFARAEAGSPPVSTVPAELAARAVEKARRGGGDVRLAAPDDDAHVPLPLRTLAVERALDNLIGNAVRYGGRAEVSVARVGETALRFTVEDDGPGIPPGRREEAMRPFARLDVARNQDRGTGVGLGLAIAQEIARAHGGRLDLSESARLGGLRADLVLAPSSLPSGAGQADAGTPAERRVAGAERRPVPRHP